MASSSKLKRIAFVLFPGYELLDVFGPMEFFAATQRVLGNENEGYVIDVVSEPKGPVSSNGGPTCAFGQFDIDGYLSSLKGKRIDYCLVPGGSGPGVRVLVDQKPFLEKLSRLCDQSDTVLSVCTGSALLARSGQLDGRRATSNKMAFAWVTTQSSKVTWEAKARWVIDGRYWTSSGVAAGMDMALAVIAKDFGEGIAVAAAKRLEYVWNPDSTHDLFEAKL